MSAHKDHVRRYLAAFNDGDLEAFDQLVTADYINHDPVTPDPEPGPAGLRSIVATMRAASPDLAFEEIALIEEDDLVAVHLLVHGVASEPVRQIQVERFRDGRIAEHWRATGSG